MSSRQKSILLVFLLMAQSWLFIQVQPTTSAEGEGEGAGDPLRVRSAMTEFRWQPSSGGVLPSNVSLVGEWNWEVPVEMVMNTITGFWSVELELDEGIYCYKFIMEGTDYIFDASNPERIYCDGVENSLARVKNHTRSTFSLELDSATGLPARILLHSGSDGSSLSTGGPQLNSGFYPGITTFNQTTEAWDIDLSVLPEGKHTFHVSGVDDDGFAAEDLLIPFWLGPQQDFIWEDALIYMVLTDRFVNGNTSNDDNSSSTASTGAGWQGGDFAGITEKIDSGYFTNLGVNALWLTPFNSAAQGSEMAGDGVHEVSGYHGYWPTAPRSVDSRLGSEAELEAMVTSAHEHGIRVMMDFVVNHVHEDHPYYSQNPEWFNQGCLCGSTDCDWNEHRLDCLFRDYMPDLDWKNRDASEQMIADGMWWLERFDLDGARLDAVKHVDDLAVYNFASRIEQRFESGGVDYYLKGETAMGWVGHELADNLGEYATINSYMGEHGLDGQADFVLYHAVVDNVLASGNMDYQHLDYWTNRSQDQYVEGAVMNPFIGSHDTPRFISRAEDSGTQWNQWVEQDRPSNPPTEAYDKARQAIGWLLTTPGAPILYMGDESGQPGGADPDNRRMMDFNLSGQGLELLNFTSELAQLRLENVALRRGVYSTYHVSENLLVFEMTLGDDSNMVVLNRGNVEQWEIPYDEVIFGDATLFDDALAISANSVTVLRHSLTDVEPEPEPENNQTGNGTAGNGTGGGTGSENQTAGGNGSTDGTVNGTDGTGNTTGDSEPDSTSEGGSDPDSKGENYSSESSSFTAIRIILLLILGLMIIHFAINKMRGGGLGEG